MQENYRVKVALVASGSGTDANAIMQAWKTGGISKAEIVCLISTVENAGCLKKAAVVGVPTHTIDYALYKRREELNGFDMALFNLLGELEVQVLFLVGCIHVISTELLDTLGIVVYNIHPADIHEHGGKKMYGLAVHEHVLVAAMDQIARGKKNLASEFYTHPTVHVALEDPDSGSPLLTGHVRIPPELLFELHQKKITMTEAAQKLQQVVLPYEWLMLPAAVNMAIHWYLNQHATIFFEGRRML